MQFKDYYAALGVDRSASADDIKRAYRKLARKYHPDVSKEADAEARFKEVAEAYEVLNDTERRAAYDDVGKRHAHGRGQDFNPPPGWDSGYEYSGGTPGDAPDFADFSEFFESMFGRARAAQAHGAGPGQGRDRHARIRIDLRDAYTGARRTVSLHVPGVDAQGRPVMQERQLDINIPKGVREGQQLRLAGQGEPGGGGGPAGDLYLEIAFEPHAFFRTDGRDVYVDLPVAPWEAAMGAEVRLPTPDGSVTLGIPAGSSAGRKLRLRGKGLPGDPAGDLYAVLRIALPNEAADNAAAKAAWAAVAQAYPDFDPRRPLEA